MPLVTPNSLSLRARWVFPVTSPPIAGGVVTINAGRIVAVGKEVVGDEVRDLGDVALLPGFVNAHTHLEFSYLSSPLGSPHMPFPDWIRSVVAHRRANAAAGIDPIESRKAAVQQGMAESQAFGVTTIGDIASPDFSSTVYAEPPQSNVVFLELLGLSNEREANLRDIAEQHLRAATTPSPWIAGLSPHAPYTVSPTLVEYACQLSAAQKAPVAMHLAESQDEVELLAAHSGRFVELLQELNAWNPSAIPRGIRPLDYLEILARAHRALVIHGNFLNSEEIRFLADHRDHMSVIYCPRTHAFFQSERHPLPTMLAAGVPVAIGTDSRASNPDLSVLNELRFIAHRYPEIDPAQILSLGTMNGANALGLAADRGSLAVGKLADFAIVPIPSVESADPHQLLFSD